MKKVILSAIAAAALGIGGLAQADVIDSVGTAISDLFGIPYDASPSAPLPIGSVYTDRYGHSFQVDAAGRHVPLDRYGSYRDQWGRTVYLGANNQPLYIAQNGQLVPYGSVAGNYAYSPSYDRDGDGISDPYDRYPRDSRYR